MAERLPGVRVDSSDLQVQELPNRPVQSLIGVSAAASTASAQVGITSVFDPGASALFAQARWVALAADPDSITANYGAVPGDRLSKATVATALGGVASLPVENLRILTASQAHALKTALDVEVKLATLQLGRPMSPQRRSSARAPAARRLPSKRATSNRCGHASASSLPNACTTTHWSCCIWVRTNR